ncbi:hypothetical protein GLAREA_07509 [Glarea lozoyensis ATCC 20868]|uniref:Uncharacterized protein n=1 Tax=Glarea lozoyensis (strain ATCC 20868 / MF5171) TaxID=1116229 RepID=S3DJZ8_GLAL2|nr:uncharacterized protein GLAREA_07509 [Glarea lozoyensis ATCC 20868]EPE32376.1 hypothetical protein GLAREA_07509 [Glarea lozoyensis ATCC 20868]
MPESLRFIEIWAVRIFVLLGFIAIGPWLLLIIYDALLYVFRTATYEIPYIGGRARNRPRPRAPSLSERPNGIARRLTLPGVSAAGEAADIASGLKKRAQKLGHDINDGSAVEE